MMENHPDRELPEKSNLIGVVMCGGLSSRMGTDKGLIRCGSKTWAGLALEKLEQIGLKSYLSINPDQLQAYSDFFSSDRFIIDTLLERGPAGGFDSIARSFPGKPVFVLACDLPMIHKESLLELLHLFQKNREISRLSAVYRSNRGLEPLCAIYSKEFLQNLHRKMQSELESPGIWKMIQEHNDEFLILEFPQNREHEIRNYNTKEDLREIMKMCAQEDSNLRPFDS